MRLLTSILLLAFTTVFTGCASKSENAAPEPGVAAAGNEKAKLVGIKENEEGRRIRLALARDDNFSVGEDAVIVTMGLQLPEIEIPRDLKRETEIHMKRTPDAGVHVYNGHVCVTGMSTSAKTVDYSDAGWKFSLRVDKKLVPVESESRPAELLNFKANKVEPLPGRLNLRVCSKGKFPKVKEVLLTLSDKKNAKLLMFQWNAPWPN